MASLLLDGFDVLAAAAEVDWAAEVDCADVPSAQAGPLRAGFGPARSGRGRASSAQAAPTPRKAAAAEALSAPGAPETKKHGGASNRSRGRRRKRFTLTVDDGAGSATNAFALHNAK